MPNQAYFDDGDEGDFYDCLEDTLAGESPITNPEKWRRIDWPAVFEPFLVSRAVSILLVAEGQSDKARSEERAAGALLEELVYRNRNARAGRLQRPKVFTR
jgi:hypothetical protein